MRASVSSHAFFEILWRISLVLLPWQTRWFHDASLVGWPWEQGRISIYAVWFFMTLTILLGVWREREWWKRIWSHYEIKILFACICITLIARYFNPLALRATTQWWLQILFLIAFATTLYRNHISRRIIMQWFVVSLIPYVLLGMWQQYHQFVIGSKWLGMATQFPQMPGVAVIEYAGQRILRIYGGFPHPNIFGGWLAIALIAIFRLAATSLNRWRTAIWCALAALFTSMLFLTYARSAWLAAIVGTIYLLGAQCIMSSDRPARLGGLARQPKDAIQDTLTRMIVTITVSLIAIICVAIPYRQLLFSRFNTTNRLEQRSLTERSVSLQTGLGVFRRHWFLGTGPNAELLEVAKSSGGDRSSSPLQPPHNVFLLMLIDMGVLGTMLLILLFWRFFRNLIRVNIVDQSSEKLVLHVSTAMLLTLIILGLFDHYLWSLWSGQVLVAMVVVMGFERFFHTEKVAK